MIALLILPQIVGGNYIAGSKFEAMFGVNLDHNVNKNEISMFGCVVTVRFSTKATLKFHHFGEIYITDWTAILTNSDTASDE